MEHGNLEALIPSIRYLHRGRPETADNFDSEDVEKLIPTVKLQYREGLSLPDVCQLILDNLPEIERPSFEKCKRPSKFNRQYKCIYSDGVNYH